MPDAPDIAAVARLVGDPSRARMLTVLMSGEARTATELALAAGVSPSTASTHLAQLTDAGLTEIVSQGRYRFFRIATSDVAAAIEGLMSIAPRLAPRRTRTGPPTAALRRARVCYDHLGGEAAVRMLERLRERQFVFGHDETMTLTGGGEAWCRRLGIDLDVLHTRRRAPCRPCLDWSERKTHLAGALGAALLERLLTLHYARREKGSRGVILSPRGEAFVEHLTIARRR